MNEKNPVSEFLNYIEKLVGYFAQTQRNAVAAAKQSRALMLEEGLGEETKLAAFGMYDRLLNAADAFEFIGGTLQEFAHSGRQAGLAADEGNPNEALVQLLSSLEQLELEFFQADAQAQSILDTRALELDEQSFPMHAKLINPLIRGCYAQRSVAFAYARNVSSRTIRVFRFMHRL